MAKSEDAGERALLEVVAQAVQMARWEDGTSRRALAESSGLSERFIADVEKCVANPSLLSLAALGRALGMTVPELVTGGPALHPRLARLAAGRSVIEQEAIADLVEAYDAGRRKASHVALLGLRGAGKTTVGKLVAKRLERAFVELDRKVEERAGLPLAQVFEIHGEPYYRQLERGGAA